SVGGSSTTVGAGSAGWAPAVRAKSEAATAKRSEPGFAMAATVIIPSVLSQPARAPGEELFGATVGHAGRQRVHGRERTRANDLGVAAAAASPRSVAYRGGERGAAWRAHPAGWAERRAGERSRGDLRGGGPCGERKPLPARRHRARADRGGLEVAERALRGRGAGRVGDGDGRSRQLRGGVHDGHRATR